MQPIAPLQVLIQVFDKTLLDAQPDLPGNVKLRTGGKRFAGSSDSAGNRVFGRNQRGMNFAALNCGQQISKRLVTFGFDIAERFPRCLVAECPGVALIAGDNQCVIHLQRSFRPTSSQAERRTTYRR